jgi:hypothetical protein
MLLATVTGIFGAVLRCWVILLIPNGEILHVDGGVEAGPVEHELLVIAVVDHASQRLDRSLANSVLHGFADVVGGVDDLHVPQADGEDGEGQDDRYPEAEQAAGDLTLLSLDALALDLGHRGQGIEGVGAQISTLTRRAVRAATNAKRG